jgi:hypothetical protein
MVVVSSTDLQIISWLQCRFLYEWFAGAAAERVPWSSFFNQVV